MDIKEVPKMSRTVRVLTNMSILAEPIQFYKSFFSVPKSPDIVTNYLLLIGRVFRHFDEGALASKIYR